MPVELLRNQAAKYLTISSYSFSILSCEMKHEEAKVFSIYKTGKYFCFSLEGHNN